MPHVRPRRLRVAEGLTDGPAEGRNQPDWATGGAIKRAPQVAALGGPKKGNPMEALAELVRTIKAYLAVDGSEGVYDAISLREARAPLRTAIAAAEEELLWEQRWTSDVAELVADEPCHTHTHTHTHFSNARRQSCLCSAARRASRSASALT